MKTFLQTVCAVALFAPCVISNANAETYGALRAGFNDAEAGAYGSNINFDQGSSYEAAIGIDAGTLRFEASASRDNAELGLVGFEGTLINYSGTALIDVRGPFGLTYSAGAGLDYSTAEANLGFTQISGEGDGWHFDLAASALINDRWSVEVRRRQYEGYVELDYVGDIDIENTDWTVGVRRAL